MVYETLSKFSQVYVILASDRQDTVILVSITNARVCLYFTFPGDHQTLLSGLRSDQNHSLPSHSPVTSKQVWTL